MKLSSLSLIHIYEGKEKIESFRERLIGRFAVGDVVNPVTGKVIVPEGKMLSLIHISWRVLRRCQG